MNPSVDSVVVSGHNWHCHLKRCDVEETKRHQAVLDTFLADNPELEQLSAQLATFNIFRALKIERAEIRHSNTLGWLLDPSESTAHF